MTWRFGNQVISWLMDEGARVDPNQPDREVYENGVEAGATQCTFFGFHGEDADGNSRVYKAHADNGQGMDTDKHREYLSTLMNSGTVLATTSAIGAPPNKGVGARIAALARNSQGVDFYSRTAAEAAAGDDWHLVRLLPDGPQIWDLEEGVDEVVSATPEETAQIAAILPKGHGTVAVFRGDGNADTWTEDSWKRTYEYMQRRYLTFPVSLKIDGTAIPTLVGRARVDYRYNMPSLRDYYSKHTGATGVVTLDDGAEIEWFVFDHTAAGKRFDDINRNTGKPYGISMATGPARSGGWRGTAVLDHNELFEHSHYRPSFGLIGKAQKRVALIITPPKGLVVQTTNRQHVEVVGGGEIPYDKWGQEFVEQMPDPIKALMESDWQASDTVSLRDLEQLDPEWYKRITAKPYLMVDPTGPLDVEPGPSAPAREGGTGGRGRAVDPSPHPKPDAGDEDGTRGGSHHSQERQKAVSIRKSAVKGRQDSFILLDLEVVWLPETSTDGPTWTDTVPDSPETEAVRTRGWAFYPHRTSRQIFLRESGDPFRKTREKYQNLHPAAHALKVWADVKNAYSIEVIAKVIHARDGLVVWPSNEVDEQFKGLALSFSLLGLNAVEKNVEQFLRRTHSQPAKPKKRVVRP